MRRVFGGGVGGGGREDERRGHREDDGLHSDIATYIYIYTQNADNSSTPVNPIGRLGDRNLTPQSQGFSSRLVVVYSSLTPPSLLTDSGLLECHQNMERSKLAGVPPRSGAKSR